jgi:hypothetical protein
MCVHYIFVIRFSCFVCHDTVSYYDITLTLTSLFINCCATSDFCLRGTYDTTYDIPIVASLIKVNPTKESFKLSISGCKLSISPTILANQLSTSSN